MLWASPGAHADFEQPVAGAGAWFHVREGSLTVLMAPASASNIGAYWEHQEGAGEGELLVDQLEGRLRAQVDAGDTLVIPPGEARGWGWEARSCSQGSSRPGRTPPAVVVFAVLHTHACGCMSATASQWRSYWLESP